MHRILIPIVWLSLTTRILIAQPITNGIYDVIRNHFEAQNKNAGAVIGLVDENGPRVVSYGHIDGPQTPELNGDTLFEIGSVTKTFTAILLQDFIDHGELRLKDPASAYLPGSVTLPSFHDRKITLLDLVTQTSALPREPDNYNPRSWKDPCVDYTVEAFYDFLSRSKLEWEPGTKYDYSNVGFALLGHILALHSGRDFEELLIERICLPLAMDSTRVTLTSELFKRSAIGHDWYGHAINDMTFRTMLGNGAIHSTANDMLKYLAANLGFTASPLKATMQKSHQVRFSNNQALGWAVSGDFVFHNGGSLGATSFAGIDLKRRRGVVILSSQSFDALPPSFGFVIMKADWRTNTFPADQLPKPTPRREAPQFIESNKQLVNSAVGAYRYSSLREITLYKSERSLVAKFNKDIGVEVRAISENRLACDYLPLEIEIIRDQSRSVSSVNVKCPIAEPELNGKATRIR